MMARWEAVDELADGPGDSRGRRHRHRNRSISEIPTYPAWMTTISTGEASER
jgi:hypothetical protein